MTSQKKWLSLREPQERTESASIIIGHSVQRHLLLVFFTEIAENLIRIFSARKATKKERKDYGENVYF